MSTRLPIMGIKESVVLGFDFSPITAAIAEPSMVVSFLGAAPNGADPTAILEGGMSISGALVTQRVNGQNAGVQPAQYLFQVTGNTVSGDTVTVGSILSVALTV